jgi:hypothetical protein
LRGDYCLYALKLLIASRKVKRHSILASDDSGLPNPAGLVTATAASPGRNLNVQAHEEFTNISYRALAELCLSSEVADDLAARCAKDTSPLIDLGEVLVQYRLPYLAHAIERAVGQPWRKAYSKARVAAPYWTPLPAIDWPLQQVP